NACLVFYPVELLYGKRINRVDLPPVNGGVSRRGDRQEHCMGKPKRSGDIRYVAYYTRVTAVNRGAAALPNIHRGFIPGHINAQAASPAIYGCIDRTCNCADIHIAIAV